MFDAIPEDRERSYSCRACHYGTITQNIIFGRWECSSCDWKSPEETDEDEQPRDLDNA